MKIWLIILIVFGTFIALYAIQQVISKVNYNYKKEGFNEIKLKVLLVHAEWCGHCKRYRKNNTFMNFYDQLKNKYPSVVFEEIDSDKHPTLVAKYGIKGYPTIIAVKSNGELLSDFIGDRNELKDLEDFVVANLKKV
jgi:thiol-disulfide isomerase/thioredoxin